MGSYSLGRFYDVYGLILEFKGKFFLKVTFYEQMKHRLLVKLTKP